MTRLSGIQLLAASLVLWALAVWVFSTPHPVETETAAAAETAAQATDEKAKESGAGASESDVAEVTTAPSAGSGQGATAPPDPATGVDDSRPRDGSKHTGIETASEPSAAGAPATPPAEVRTPPAAIGESSQIALAPAPASGDSAADSTTPLHPTGTGPAAGSSTIPGDTTAGSPGGNARRPDAPPGAATPRSWPENPMSRPPPPARPSSSAADGSAVAGQLNAGRRAAWEGRFADALSHYRAAARLRPNDYVVWGEMGNVLWTMRRWSEAAYALEGAATLLVRAGELRAASDLVPAVGRIDPDAAYRVQRLVWAAAQRQSG